MNLRLELTGVYLVAKDGPPVADGMNESVSGMFDPSCVHDLDSPGRILKMARITTFG